MLRSTVLMSLADLRPDVWWIRRQETSGAAMHRGVFACVGSNAPKRPQEKKCTANNGDSQQAKHDYCHPRNLS
jgi:hypothetical protein